MNKREVGYVYKITSPTNRVYIGSSINIKIRWSSYKRLDCKDQPKLYRSLKKYGSEDHLFEIIWRGNLEEMFKFEHLYGVQYNVLKKGLNCSLPGYNDVLKKMDETSKRKMSLAKKGKPSNMLGKNHSDETKAKMAISQKKRLYTDEAKEKLSLLFIGRKLSEETRLKISIAKKGVKHKS